MEMLVLENIESLMIAGKKLTFAWKCFYHSIVMHTFFFSIDKLIQTICLWFLLFQNTGVVIEYKFKGVSC